MLRAPILRFAIKSPLDFLHSETHRYFWFSAPQTALRLSGVNESKSLRDF